MKNTKLIIVTTLILGGIYLGSVTPTYANGFGYENMLKEKAGVLKMKVENLKEKLQNGMRFLEIAKQKGISHEELSQRMQANKEKRLQRLVDEGKISEAQKQERLQWMNERHEECEANPENCQAHRIGGQVQRQGFRQGLKQGFGMGLRNAQ